MREEKRENGRGRKAETAKSEDLGGTRAPPENTEVDGPIVGEKRGMRERVRKSLEATCTASTCPFLFLFFFRVVKNLILPLIYLGKSPRYLHKK